MTPFDTLQEYISIKGARQHNLKNIDIDIPINKLTVITGISGSGKSSLAFDTLYAEGQRRYVESLSAYARQFLGVMDKPDVDSIKGLSPAIAIEQKKLSHNPRSTVGTITEIYDYLRLLYARIGIPHCPVCKKKIQPQDAQSITGLILGEYTGCKTLVLSPLVRGRKGSYEYLFNDLKQQGFTRVRVDNSFYNLDSMDEVVLKRYVNHYIEVVIDRLLVDKFEKSRLQEAIEQALKHSNGFALVLIEKRENTDDKKYDEKLFSQHLACVDCGLSFDELQPRMFSFNSPQGACPECHGIGSIYEFDENLIMPDKNLSIMQGGIAPWRTQVFGLRGQMIETLSQYYNFNPEIPIKQLPCKIINLLLWGSNENIDFNLSFRKGTSSFNYSGVFEGVIPQLKRLYKQTESEERRTEIGKYMVETLCPKCKGQRLKPISLAVGVGEKSIIELTELSIEDTLFFFENLELTETAKKIANQVIKEIKRRLKLLLNLGLTYLSLSRSSGSLSSGEAQRIHLATQIGSELRGVLYILDEPSIGLHQRDNKKLIETLKTLRDLGNTVIVVEHDEETILLADNIIDIGPGAGVYGGYVVADGTTEDIKNCKKSLTGQYLARVKRIDVPNRRRFPHWFLTIMGAGEHNLKNIDVKIPLSVFCCVTGVSGSGKSTLINEILYKALARYFYHSSEKAGKYKEIDGITFINKVIMIDQMPIGRTPRSNPATYTGLFTYIRDLFASTKEAKIRGYKAGRFSFNVADGRCGNCEGNGLIKIEMQFLPDVYITCDVCKGKRYNDETLSVLYKEKNISDILNMTLEEALEFFKNIPRIKNKLQTLQDVGLKYIKLGQSATTLSGGEAQRIKLASELSRRDTGRTLYLLDEPTTGLHFDDIKKLLSVLNRLVDRGNTVLVIEHNLDVIKTSDYIIDLGPEGGGRGGEIIATGTPEEIAKIEKSYTGQFLKKILGGRILL